MLLSGLKLLRHTRRKKETALDSAVTLLLNTAYVNSYNALKNTDQTDLSLEGKHVIHDFKPL